MAKIPEFVSLKPVKKACPNAKYYLLFGQRSNGKTFCVLEEAINVWWDSQETQTSAIVRRWEEDFKGKNGSDYFEGFIFNKYRGNILQTITKGKYNAIIFFKRAWYAVKLDEKGEEVARSTIPVAIAFAITKQVHYKSISFPRVKLIVLDEMVARSYLPNEFIEFMNLVSTIVRERDDITIYMLGNTLSGYCPYIAEMGLKNVRNMKQGDIEVYKYANLALRVVVYMTDKIAKNGKASDVYFAFDNPQLKMITGASVWELANYPHCPFKYKPNEIKYIYFIKFDQELMQCEIINHEKQWITFIHRKTTPIKEDDKGYVFQQDFDPRPNYHRRISHCTSKLGKFICSFFFRDKVFYQDNEIGDLVSQYLQWQDRVK